MIIVEDLETDQRKLADLIRQDSASHEESVDLSFYASGEDFLAHYRPKSCDGLLLDILLGGMNGIEAARKVRELEPYLPVILSRRAMYVPTPPLMLMHKYKFFFPSCQEKTV